MDVYLDLVNGPGVSTGLIRKSSMRSALEKQRIGDPVHRNPIMPSIGSAKPPRPLSTVGTMDIYFSADIETDGPIPGPFSMLSFALVPAGRFDGHQFIKPTNYEQHFYAELRPISERFEPEALKVNGLDRARLMVEGGDPQVVMTQAAQWIAEQSVGGQPVLIAYPLSFDWSWLYWYFVQFSQLGSPFEHSKCFDLKTAYAVKAGIPIAEAGRSRIPHTLRGEHQHTHHALDDAIEQALLFANIFTWKKS